MRKSFALCVVDSSEALICQPSTFCPHSLTPPCEHVWEWRPTEVFFPLLLLPLPTLSPSAFSPTSSRLHPATPPKRLTAKTFRVLGPRFARGGASSCADCAAPYVPGACDHVRGVQAGRGRDQRVTEVVGKFTLIQDYAIFLCIKNDKFVSSVDVVKPHSSFFLQARKKTRLVQKFSLTAAVAQVL